MEDRDVQTVMQALFEIKRDVRTILDLLTEDGDGEEAEEEEP
jgi:hypothetical protein